MVISMKMENKLSDDKLENIVGGFEKLEIDGKCTNCGEKTTRDVYTAEKVCNSCGHREV